MGRIADKIKEFELAMEDWSAERERLLARIKELEEELAATRAEMRQKLDEAENEKDKALDKVRLLLTGNQKQGFLYHFESSLVGMVWKKRFFVLRDNLLS